MYVYFFHHFKNKKYEIVDKNRYIISQHEMIGNNNTFPAIHRGSTTGDENMRGMVITP